MAARRALNHVMSKAEKAMQDRNSQVQRDRSISERLFGRSIERPIGTLANDADRRFAIKAMVRALHHHHQHNRKRDLRTFLGTFCYSDGVINGPYILDGLLQRYRNKVDRAIREMGLDGICVLQLVAVKEDDHYTYHLHAHAVLWTDDRTFRPIPTVKAMNLKRASKNAFGARAVDLRSRRQAAAYHKDKDSDFYKFAFSRLKKQDQTHGSMAWLGYYMLRPPIHVQKVVPRASAPDDKVMRSNYHDCRGHVARRLLELEAQVPVREAVFAVGEGKAVRKTWLKQYR